VLATPIARDLDRFMQATFEGSATIYSKAMDAEYIRTHIGGGWHRLYDGGHSVWGAWQAIRDADPNDSLADEVLHFAHEYWKDLVTVRGMPIATFDKEWLASTTAMLNETLNVSPIWLRDLLTFTSTEVGGGVVAIAALLVNLRAKDPMGYAQLVGSLGISGAVAANPVLLGGLVLFMLAAATKEALQRSDLTSGERITRVGAWAKACAPAVAKGAAISGSIIGVTSIIGGPIGLAVGIGTAFVGTKVWTKAEQAINKRMARRFALVMLNEYRHMRLALPAPT
jgi:hypothetical protein